MGADHHLNQLRLGWLLLWFPAIDLRHIELVLMIDIQAAGPADDNRKTAVFQNCDPTARCGWPWILP
jgi:hypothetical protein